MLVKGPNSEYWQVLILGIAFRWTLMLVNTDRSLIAGRIVKTEQFWLPSLSEQTPAWYSKLRLWQSLDGGG